jgi:hypothetical protein
MPQAQVPVTRVRSFLTLINNQAPVKDVVIAAYEAQRRTEFSVDTYGLVMRYITENLDRESPPSEKQWCPDRLCVLAKKSISAFLEHRDRKNVDISGMLYTLATWPTARYRLCSFRLLLSMSEDSTFTSLITMKSCVMSYMALCACTVREYMELSDHKRFLDSMANARMSTSFNSYHEETVVYCKEVLRRATRRSRRASIRSHGETSAVSRRPAQNEHDAHEAVNVVQHVLERTIISDDQ